MVIQLLNGSGEISRGLVLDKSTVVSTTVCTYDELFHLPFPVAARITLTVHLTVDNVQPRLTSKILQILCPE